jgi:hypothetical protein
LFKKRLVTGIVLSLCVLMVRLAYPAEHIDYRNGIRGGLSISIDGMHALDYENFGCAVGGLPIGYVASTLFDVRENCGGVAKTPPF